MPPQALDRDDLHQIQPQRKLQIPPFLLEKRILLRQKEETKRKISSYQMEIRNKIQNKEYGAESIINKYPNSFA